MNMPPYFKDMMIHMHDLYDVQTAQAQIHASMILAMEFEAEVIDGVEFTGMLDDYSQYCYLCGEKSTETLRYREDVFDCTNPDCCEIRDVLRLGRACSSIAPHQGNYADRNHPHAISREVIRRVAKEYGEKCKTLHQIPASVRLEAAQQAMIYFLIEQCKGEIKNGKARI